jgi:tetratricopeptide (TPR) repeat protein
MEYRFRLGHYLSNEITDITHSNLESALLAKKYFELAGEIGFMDFAETALSLQNYFQKIGDYERAIALNNTVLGLQVNHLLHSDARNNLGMIAYHQSDIDTAQNFFEQSLEIRKLENNEIRIAESYHNIATLYHKLKKYEEAKAYFQESLTIKRALIEQGSTEHVTLHITLNNLSQISDELGERDEALDYLNESLRIAQQAGDKQGEWTASINMANIYLKMGDATTALQYYLKAEALQDQEAQPNEQIALLLKIGQLYAALPDYPKALQRVLQAFTLAKQYDLDNEKVKFRLGEIIYHAGRQTVATWLKSYKK